MTNFSKLKKRNLLLGAAIILLLQACNVKKFIPEDELLYTGGEVEITNLDSIPKTEGIQEEVQSVIRPNPNGKFLGMRPGLYFHYKAQQNSNFINRWLNKNFGEEPVYASDVRLEEVEDIILNRLENRGFFYSRISSVLNENEEVQEAGAVYTVNMATPYLLEGESYIIENKDSIQLYRDIENMKAETLIEPGMRFDLPAMKAERERIDLNLKKKGYYNFNPRFLIFEADTNQYNNKRFDLFLRLKKEVPTEAVIPYKIKRINIYPNHRVDRDSMAMDTVRYEEKNYIQTNEFFKPKRLDPYLLLEEGELYNPEDSRFTSRRLSSIGAYKFVNIRYDEIDSLRTDSLGLLEANIFLSPLTKRAIRAELQGVAKSNDFVGPKLSVIFTNRNLFKGGEILNLSSTVGYEWQMASGDDRSYSSIQVGAEGDLIFPRMLFPISLNNDWFRYSIPKTKISLGSNFLSRTDLYQMYTISGRFGYVWRANRYVTHELSPININYVNLSKVTDDFQTLLDNNPYLSSSFEQQFIAGLLYSFTYNGMVDAEKTHQFFLNANLDLAGNTLSLFGKSEDDEPATVGNLEYAQYAKLDADFRYHYKFGIEKKIATRLFAGYGNPYGNSEVMPFSKQYFSGGPYSVRAFRIRSLGPGSYNPEEGDGAYFDQAGNVRLEANIEYRFPIYSFFKGAVFADAGNVWNTGEIEYLPGGKFSSDFLNELGVGIGVGLRIDIQNFILRFDLAAPMRTPWLEPGKRWNWDFGSPVLNFGIGYPF